MTKQIKLQQPVPTGLRNGLPGKSDNVFENGNLLNQLIIFLGLKNDAALARELQVAPPILSKIRHGKLLVSAAILIRMHEVSGLSIHELRACMGDHRKRFGLSDQSISRVKMP